jgi:phosphoribosylformylglycinamidine synthase
MREGDSIVLVGGGDSGEAAAGSAAGGAGGAGVAVAAAALGGSRWAVELHGLSGGPLPHLDVERHQAVCELVRELVAGACRGEASVAISGLHDVSDGGLALCLAELCCASSVGAVIDESWTTDALFTEAPSRVIVCTSEAEALVSAAAAAGVPARVIGFTGGDRLVVPGLVDLAVAELVSVRARRLPEAADQATA